MSDSIFCFVLLALLLWLSILLAMSLLFLGPPGLVLLPPDSMKIVPGILDCVVVSAVPLSLLSSLIDDVELRIRAALATTNVGSREAGPAGPHLPTPCYSGPVTLHSISSGTLNSPARSAQCQHTTSPVLSGACVVASSMSPHSSHSWNGSPNFSAILRSIHPLSVLRISCLLLSMRSSGGFALRSGSAADAVIAGGRVRVRGQGRRPKRKSSLLLDFLFGP
jgi:hypothetical protein